MAASSGKTSRADCDRRDTAACSGRGRAWGTCRLANERRQAWRVTTWFDVSTWATFGGESTMRLEMSNASCARLCRLEDGMVPSVRSMSGYGNSNAFIGPCIANARDQRAGRRKTKHFGPLARSLAMQGSIEVRSQLQVGQAPLPDWFVARVSLLTALQDEYVRAQHTGTAVGLVLAGRCVGSTLVRRLVAATTPSPRGAASSAGGRPPRG
jgi:hypothetical protein